MKTGPILQLALLLMLLAGPSEEFFLTYPKKALMDFFQSLKTKKTPPKTDVQHYHVHYYPLPVPSISWKTPDKRDLDKLFYSDFMGSLGWGGYQYKFAPDPLIVSPIATPSNLQQLFDEPSSWDQDVLGSEDSPSIDQTMKGILVQIPANQIVLQLMKKSLKNTAKTSKTSTT